MIGCEVRDYVQAGDGTRWVRTHNEAANDELVRRGLAAAGPSGELTPYAIAWVNTCGGEWIDEGV